MIGFWIFVIVLVICATVVICVFLQNADSFKAWDVDKRLREVNNHLCVIEEDLRKLLKGGVEHE